MIFSELSDFGLIFIAIAIFGYIISDTFKSFKHYGIPDNYKSDIERFFHHISNGLIALSFLIVFTLLIISAPNKDNSLTKFLSEFINIFDKFHDNGIISDYYYTTVLRIFVFSFLPAFAFMMIYAITAFFGFIFKLSQEVGLRVFLKGKEKEPIEAIDLISESDQFFYIAKKGGLWAAIRKDEVEKIETIRTLSLLQKSISEISNRIKIWWTEHQQNKPIQ